MCIWFLMHHIYATASNAGTKEHVIKAGTTHFNIMSS